MREKLLYAILNCTEMDADFKMTDTDVAGWSLPAPQQFWSSINNDD